MCTTRSVTSILALFLLIGTSVAQTLDIVVFSEAGERFTLMVDGEERNAEPASRVVARNVRNSTPQVLVRFQQPGVPPLKQNAWMEPGQEYTIRITTNKRGERVFRMQGATPLINAAAATTDKARPTDFQDDPDTTGSVGVSPEDGRSRTGSPRGSRTNGVRARLAPGGLEMRPAPAQSFSGNGHAPRRHRPDAEPPVEVYRMPGYTGPVGCAQPPMPRAEFEGLKGGVADKRFEDSRISTAKTMAANRCFSAEQVKELLGVFNFEDSRLDFAKFAYDRTHDIGNYQVVHEAFRFDSSVEELDQYIRSR